MWRGDILHNGTVKTYNQDSEYDEALRYLISRKLHCACRD